MPSRVEPWTESNVFAAIWYNPIVRKTGGLKDTVIDFGDNGNGISHDQSSVGDICYSIQRAINLYKDKEHLNAIRNTGMNTDHSWEKQHVKNI
jgi:starch synthase